MIRHRLLLSALFLAAPALAQDDPLAPAPEPTQLAPESSKADPLAPAPDAQQAPPEKLQSLLENCDAHKFETVVDSVVDGQPHRSKVKMCGKDGQSDEGWIGTLQDAVNKLEVDDKMPAATRDQIIAAIKLEIARLQSGGSAAAAAPANRQPAEIIPLPPGRQAGGGADSLSDDYTVFKPLETAPPAPARVYTPPADMTAAPAAASGVSGVAAAPVLKTLAPPGPPPPPLPKPRLSFECITSTFASGGPCVELNRDTILVAKAGEAVPAGLSLQFVRNADVRFEQPLGALRKGQQLRMKIPSALCKGVSSAEVELRLESAGRVAATEGPFLLRC